MAAKRNAYEKQTKKKGFLSGITDDLSTKGDMKNSAIETVKDLLVGVLGGGVVGAAIGKTSLLVGAAVTGIGHFTKSRLTSIFGIGMMASNGFQGTDKSVSGTDENKPFVEGVKERILNFKDSMKQKLFVDKLLKPKDEASATTNGMGEVKYFVYPNGEEVTPQLNLGSMNDLERIERQIAESGAQFVNKQIQGTEGVDGLEAIDPTERNF